MERSKYANNARAFICCASTINLFSRKNYKRKKTIEVTHEFTREFKESSSRVLEFEQLAESVEHEKY